MKTKSFEKMTAAEKRVAIAQDAVKQIQSKKYKISHRCYLSMGSDSMRVNQATLQKEPCDCCAAGAMLASLVRIKNGFDVAWADSIDTMNALKRYFPQQQVALVEAAFERGSCSLSSRAREGGSPVDQLALKRAVSFMETRNLSSTRLALAIFRNIIANKGEFKP